MIGCSPCQDSFGEYKTYGHSIVVDPYGQVIKKLLGNEGMMEVDIDLTLIDEARKKIPIIKNKVKLEG